MSDRALETNSLREGPKGKARRALGTVLVSKKKQPAKQNSQPNHKNATEKARTSLRGDDASLTGTWETRLFQ